MAFSGAGMNFLSNWEGCKLKTYKCAAGKDTIGIGHVLLPGELEKFKNGITKAEAIQLCLADLKSKEFCIKTCVKVPISQRQYDALVSFVFNIGVNAFKASTLLRKLNARDFAGASNEFVRWNKDDDGNPIAGLTRRREAEKALFLSKAPTDPSKEVKFYRV